MVKISIIDDDLQFMDDLEVFSKHYSKENKIEFQITKIDPTLMTIDEIVTTNLNCDILLIDIEMPNFSGIDVASKIREVNKLMFICFITSYSEYAIDTYGIHAFDYILKPITQDKINGFFSDLFTYFVPQRQEEDLEFQTTEGFIRLEAKDILYFEYMEKSKKYKNRVIVIHSKGSKKYAIDQAIGNFYESLNQNMFIMSHKSFIVNMYNIKLIKGEEIRLINDVVIPLSQKRRKVVKESFQLFLKQI